MQFICPICKKNAKKCKKQSLYMQNMPKISLLYAKYAYIYEIYIQLEKYTKHVQNICKEKDQRRKICKIRKEYSKKF